MFNIGDECRIKTEKEFINQYGNKWRNKVCHTFPPIMDFLFGRKFIIYNIYKPLNKYYSIDHIEIGFAISEDMLTYLIE